MTRNADSVKTPLDEKMVDPYSIAGVVYVELIEPGIVTVNEADNEVHYAGSSSSVPFLSVLPRSTSQAVSGRSSLNYGSCSTSHLQYFGKL